MDLFETAMKTAFGKASACPVKIAFCNNAKDAAFAAFLAELGGFMDPLVVCDENTYKALGKRASECLRAQHLLLPGKPKPDAKTAAKVATVASDHDSIIAVGSGTINDLCKYGAYLSGKPYAVFPTACSMNGYTSSNASIISEDGVKASMNAKLPKGILVDIAVASNAPVKLNSAGFADLLCRPTVQCDWMLSHLLLGTEYNPLPFQMLQPVETALLKNPAGVKKGDAKTIRLLMEGLLISGFGMHISGGSFPASQGEHMIAHALELMYPEVAARLLHGELVGVCTIHTATMQETILTKGSLNISTDEFPEQLIQEVFGKKECAVFKREFEKKKLKIRNSAHATINLSGIRKVHMKAKTIVKILRSAGAATTPEDIGIGEREFRKAANLARFTRSRFTFLDACV